MYESESLILTNEDTYSFDLQQQFHDETNLTIIPVHQSTVTLSTLATTDAQDGSSSPIQRNTASPAISTSNAQQISPIFISAPISPVASTSSNSDAQQNNSTFITPGPIRPALSTPSSHGTSSAQQRRLKKGVGRIRQKMISLELLLTLLNH